MERLLESDFLGATLLRRGAWTVVVGAEWCPCSRAFRAILAHLEEERAPVRLAWADVTHLSSSLWGALSLGLVPTLFVFFDGQPVWRRDGVRGEGLGQSDLAVLARVLRVVASWVPTPVRPRGASPAPPRPVVGTPRGPPIWGFDLPLATGG